MSRQIAKRLEAVARAVRCADHNYNVNVDEAVATHLADVFESKHRHEVHESQAPDRPGVYAIYRKGNRAPVYVGKASVSLRRRLREHSKKIGETKQLAGMKFECAYLAIPEAWWVVLAESFLINEYKPPWNGAGFAGHVPGSGRPGKAGQKSLWQQYLDGDLTDEEARERALPQTDEEA